MHNSLVQIDFWIFNRNYWDVIIIVFPLEKKYIVFLRSDFTAKQSF